MLLSLVLNREWEEKIMASADVLEFLVFLETPCDAFGLQASFVVEFYG